MGGGPPGGNVFYYRDVQPIMQLHCGSCHAPGGVGPFALTTYEEVKRQGPVVVTATESRHMPPWLPQAGCGDFRDSRALSDAEIATLRAWVEAGMPAGDPAQAPVVSPRPGASLGSPSLTLDPGEDYRANPTVTDDYHCFLIDPALTQARDLIGFDVQPGQRQAVHHVLLYAIPAARAAAARAKDTAEPGVGWTCFGGTGVADAATVGGWVPGSGASAFPPPTGIRIAAGTQIVMQIHYNLLLQRDVTDRTRADLFFSATPVAKPAAILAVANTSFRIPAGTKEMTVTQDLNVQAPSALWGVVPHMHVHGRKLKVELVRASGAVDCAVDIPRWDFHWQQFYYYQQPMVALPGDKVRLSCTYDNSRESQPIVGGVPLPTMDLTWGERTTDEMCLNYLYVATP
jgi:hypothetical protein